MRGVADLIMADIKAKDTGDIAGVPTARGAFSLSAIQARISVALSLSLSVALALPPPPILVSLSLCSVCACVPMLAHLCVTAQLMTWAFWISGEGRWARGCQRPYTALAHGPQRS
jgi:hypothetical protein